MNASNHRPDDHASWRAAIVLAAIVLVAYGFLYSLAGTALGRMFFPYAATGSLLEQRGKVVGSALVAQPFADARYFAPRPSAAGYDPMRASGSNAARSNPELRKRLDDAVSAVAAREGVAREAVPGDLVTESGGGLDPHISPAAARLQVARVARARGLAEDDVAALVERYVERPQFGVFGQARVNVLELNLALDARTR
ncbi:potassium-transporting ATPase subunit KdpC [Dokdonella sp.]|uniref:potassium-transporting ATPase subunit KdpC n=1 Tax=Dokdonella sp. TaxID=2291710 RepID=UPI002F41E13C